MTDSNIPPCVEQYFDGLFRGDVTTLRAAFHPRARLTGVVGGRPYERDLDSYLAVVAERMSPAERGEKRRMTIEQIVISGQVGHVRARVGIFGTEYVDFLSLVRHDERWVIIHKNFTDVDPSKED